MRSPATLVDLAIVLLVASLLQSTLFAAFVTALARAVGARIREIRIGLGRVWRRAIGGIEIAIGVLPLGASVGFMGHGADDDYDGPGALRRLSLARRLTLMLGPWAATLVLGAVLLGPSRAITSFGRTASQVFLTMDYTPLVRGLVAVLDREGVAVAAGVFLVKIGALNLLQPGMAGWLALHEISTAMRPEGRQSQSMLIAGAMIGMALFVTIVVRLAIAVYRIGLG